MMFTSDPEATATRINALRRYMDEQVLGSSGRCVCRHLDNCRRSALFDRHGTPRSQAAFAAGQLSHVGHHYDLLHNGVTMRTLVIAMETGRPRQGVTLEARHAEVMQSASLLFNARNPHMRGVTSALRLAVGREPGTDRKGEHLRLHGTRSPVHLFDAYAMANMRLCSATVQGTSKSLGNATMSRNCLPHMTATIRILEPTLCIVQGTEVFKALTPLMNHRRRLGPQLEQARISGVDTLVAALTHPSAMRLSDHWGRLTSAPYLQNIVIPTIRTAYEMITADRLATGLAGTGDGQDVVIDAGGAAAAASLGFGGAEPVEGAFADEVAFHLGGREQHLVGDGGTVGAVDTGADAGEDVQVDPAAASS